MSCYTATLTDVLPYSATVNEQIYSAEVEDGAGLSATIADVPSYSGELTESFRYSAVLEDC